MVKNKKGGRHKHMARKHVNASNNFRSRKLREPKESGEMIARIVKIEGGSNFEVLCNDNKRRLLVVRKKFKGRNKRDNSLKIDRTPLGSARSSRLSILPISQLSTVSER